MVAATEKPRKILPLLEEGLGWLTLNIDTVLWIRKNPEEE
jgi:hypothetical protein